MAKGNNNKPKSNYFAQEIQKKGENFLEGKTSKDMQWDAQRVFRDLARGNVNIDQYYIYFLEVQFLDNCIKFAYDKMTEHNYCFMGTNLLFTQLGCTNQMMCQPQQMNELLAVVNKHKRSYEAYSMIFTSLNNLKLCGDPAILKVLSNNLKNYRNAL